MPGRDRAASPPPPPPPSDVPEESLPLPPGLPAEPDFDVVFERAHLEEVPRAPGVGGKTTCQWQRALRTQCIANDV
eukprot:2890101-Pyramimonas_sp.AAC.1